MVDGHFADSFRCSDHGLAHRGTPASNRDQRPVHVTLHVVWCVVDRLLDHFDATEKLVVRERLVEVGEAAEKRPPRREQPLIRRLQPLPNLFPRVRAFGGERRNVQAAHAHRIFDRPAVEFVGHHRKRIGNLHRKVPGVDVAGRPQLSREFVIDVDPLHQLEEFAEEDAEHRPLRAVPRPSLAGLLRTKLLKDCHDLRKRHAGCLRFCRGGFRSGSLRLSFLWRCGLRRGRLISRRLHSPRSRRLHTARSSRGGPLLRGLFCGLFHKLFRCFLRRLFRRHVILPNKGLQNINHSAPI